MANADYSQAAMVLALIGALSFIVAAVLGFIALASIESIGAVSGIPASLMGGALMMVAIISVVCGIVVLVGALMIKNPAKRQTASILVLVFGVIGFLGGGGIILTGTILSVIAGILGLISKS